MKLLFITNLKEDIWMKQTLWGEWHNEIACKLWIERFPGQKPVIHLAGL